jgi:hypothetical protein
MSMKAAMRNRSKEALPVIEAELRQMHDKAVCGQSAACGI